MKRKKVLILGAAGRDFHNFNLYFRGKKEFEVVGFTAAQIPGIGGRRYPKELAGKLYSKGIPIYEERDLEKLIKRHKIDSVVFSYSDVSHEHVMHLASRANAAGANFVLLGGEKTMLKSRKPVLAVCAVRTGAGKSPLTKYISRILKKSGKRVAIIRHPMPYGDLRKQEVQRFASIRDLKKAECTVEEREEYEGHIKNGFVVFAGVDYEKILRKAEKEADIILWDGGNNDLPFYESDLHIVVADALRPGHELKYYPGEANFRMADVIVINKVSGSKKGAGIIRKNAKEVNSKAKIFETDTILSSDFEGNLKGKRVLAIDDGPTITHGGMSYGAGYLYAKRKGAKLIEPRRFAVGSIKKAYSKYRHMGRVLPALGYSRKQLKELEKTIENAKPEVVVSGTPMDLRNVIKVNVPIVHVSYKIKERKGSMKRLVKEFILS
ncbi:GTPase [Candidatus Micrarchaeota archaeon]|nr:GTPase [Candidatus Micrarchaeota archaeon]